VYVSWYDALRFANWLHNGQPTGAQDSNTTEDGAYTFTGATNVAGPAGDERNPGAIWFLPDEGEWYKAAYYDGSSDTYYDYPTGTDTIPDNHLPSADSGDSINFRAGPIPSGYTTGNFAYPMTDSGAYTLSASPYGTFDQGGSVSEWNETVIHISGLFAHGLRGGSWDITLIALHASGRNFTFDAAAETFDIGFRVATIPEPSSTILAAFGLAGLAACGWRRRAQLL
jgi:formylglycine-generating enzyme required for sulfatase activity